MPADFEYWKGQVHTLMDNDAHKAAMARIQRGEPREHVVEDLRVDYRNNFEQYDPTNARVVEKLRVKVMRRRQRAFEINSG